ncbi:MAG: helix-turn-helix transcriptional regulator [Oligoflexia bacterium]|nr:helix-turn-helix transcriptional regulator [Oligoflexia bacterium]
MRCFQNMAKLIRSKRLGHPKSYSQSELSHMLGYKNGQFISNVERSLCSIPFKMLRRVSEILDIPLEDLKIAVLKDQEQTINRYLYSSQKRKDNNLLVVDDESDESDERPDKAATHEGDEKKQPKDDDSEEKPQQDYGYNEKKVA